MWLVVGEGHWKQSSWEYSAACLSLKVAIWQNLAPPIRPEKPQAKQQQQLGSETCPSVNRLPKVPPDTQPPLTSPRDKTPPTRGIGISPTYQWADTNPSHQEAYSKPLYQLQPQGGQTQEAEEAVTLLSAKRLPHQKPI